MNGHVNCILGVCCPPGSAVQVAALAEEIEKAHTWMARTEGASYALAGWILKNFDLAPAGTLQAFKDEVARLARENNGQMTATAEPSA